MDDTIREKLIRVCRDFRIPGVFDSYETIKRGNINNTYKVNFITPEGKQKSYMVQAVNTNVFREPVKVMDNIDNVTEYIHAKYPGCKVLHFHHTRDRKTYVFDESGFWRLFNYIPSVTYDQVNDLEVVYNGGVAFGRFQVQLRDFRASDLYTTIPDFHHTTRRYEKLAADRKADPCGRVAQVREELDWLLSVQDRACELTRLYEEGQLPLRVTHNDTKINNVLFDQETNKAIVVIDLDTIMPGLVGHDFGDAIRFAANKVAEDCPQADQAGIDMEVFRAFTEGFLSEMAPYLTQNEVDTLALSCFALTCELATRFLDDYITGDTYFKTHRPGHNLDRARCQIALAKDMQRHKAEMERIVRECAQRVRP